MIADDQLAEYQAIRDHAATSLRQDGARVIVPDVLPSELYADASHPLTAGYELLARGLAKDPIFSQWIRPSGESESRQKTNESS